MRLARLNEWQGQSMNPVNRVWQLGGSLVDAVAAVPRLVGRAGLLLEEATGLLVSAAALIDEVAALVRRIEVVRVDAADVVVGAARVVGDAGATATDAAGVLAVIGPPAVATRPLLSAVGEIDPTLVRWLVGLTQDLRPLLSTLASLDETIAADTTELVRRMPELLREVDELIVPALNLLGEAVPEVREITSVVQRLEAVFVDVETRLAGLPGSNRLRKRGEREIEAAPRLDHRKLSKQLGKDGE